jgi:flagellar motor protein MotB
MRLTVLPLLRSRGFATLRPDCPALPAERERGRMIEGASSDWQRQAQTQRYPMTRHLAISILAASLVALGMGGCQQGPFQPKTAAKTAPAASGVFQQPSGALASQMQDLNRRVGQLDLNNADLHRQLAQAQQDRQTSQEQVALLQKQLGEVASRLKDTQVAKLESDKQINALQASTRSRGGATITANNSVRQSLAAVAIPGLDIRQDGEVIRIEIPADKLFLPGNAQLQTDGYRILDEVAAAVQRTYSRQRIVVEGHTDDSLSVNPTAAHSLATAQAQAVFGQLVQRGRLPARQLSVLAMGENHPLASNATPAGKAKNRRVEIVVYPDTIDG